jgi:hypothetical protein
MDTPRPSVVQIEGIVRGGTKFVTFEGGLPESPLELACEVCLDSRAEPKARGLMIDCHLEKWFGRPVLLLPGFDQIDALRLGLGANQRPKIEMQLLGNRTWSGELLNQELKTFRGLDQTLDWLAKCRSVAERFKINPVLPPFTTISLAQLEAVEEVYELLSGVEWPNSIPLPVRVTVSKSPEEIDVKAGPGLIRIDSPERYFEVLGERVRIGAIQFYFTGMTLISCSPSPDGGSELLFEGSEDSTRIVKYS